MVDGVSSVELITATHDLKPKTEVSNTEVQWQPRPAPDRLTRMRHAVRERLTETVQWWTDEVFGLLDSTRIKERWRQTAKTVSSLLPTLYQLAPQIPYRSQGLGRILADEIFAISRELGLRKIVAQMTADQTGAIATFERLGFQTEALLQDFVIDRMDRTRDLLIMSYDMTGFTVHVN